MTRAYRRRPSLRDRFVRDPSRSVVAIGGPKSGLTEAGGARLSRLLREGEDFTCILITPRIDDGCVAMKAVDPDLRTRVLSVAPTGSSVVGRQADVWWFANAGGYWRDGGGLSVRLPFALKSAKYIIQTGGRLVEIDETVEYELPPEEDA